MKIVALHRRIIKIMKILEFDASITKIITNRRIPVEHHENHENHRIPYDNFENHENTRIPMYNN